ncbi:MAG: HNH endonuclease [Polyangiaceae bacterium]|nr:HNH endonuclease [Polyangiaceae bacterium]
MTAPRSPPRSRPARRRAAASPTSPRCTASSAAPSSSRGPSPDELLHAFQTRAAALPRTTEAERLTVQRVGQDLFRGGLLEYWDSRCAITGLAVVELLRASHIKPWADCAADAERLDVFNGILLAPHLDAAFDRGFITLADDGAVIVSSALAEPDRRILGLDAPLRIRSLHEGHRAYLPWHRERVFKGR